MREMKEEYEEYDENGEEYLEEVEEDPEEIPREELEIPDVCWEKQLREIDDREVQKREIKAAEEIVEKQKELDEQYDADEITEYQH